MKILITGASGFLGKNFVLSCPREWEVFAVYHHSEDFPNFLNTHDKGNVKPVRLNLGSAQEVQDFCSQNRRFDAGIYFAANGDPAVSVKRPAFDLVSNTLSLVHLLEASEYSKFIFFSSGAVYDHLKGPVTPESPVHPTLPYAISKLASEQYVEHFQKQGKIGTAYNVRFFGAYGPYEPARKVYTKLVQRFAFEKNPEFTIRGDGKNLIDAMYIDDAIEGIHRLLNSQEKSRTLDFYSGQPISLSELVETAARTFHLNPRITYEGIVPEYIEFKAADTFLSKHLGFQPSTDLQTGLIRLYEHLKK